MLCAFQLATRTNRLLNVKGKRTVASFHRELGKVMWEYCGMARNEEGLKTALRKIPNGPRGLSPRTVPQAP